MDGSKNFSQKGLLFIAMNVCSWLLFFMIPPIHAKTIILLIFAISGWGMKVLPQPIISLLIMVYIPILGVGTFSDSLNGFSQSFIWLLVSTFLLAAGVEVTGLGKRLALWLLMRAKGKSDLSILYTFFTVLVLGIMMPTASGRTATIMPVCHGMTQVMEGKPIHKNFSKFLMIGVAFTSGFISWGVITGSSSSIYAVSFIESSTGFKWTYMNWLLYNFPLMIAMILIMWIVFKFIYPLTSDTMEEGYVYVKNELQALGSMNNEEWKMCAIGLFTIVGWLTEQFHGYSVAMVALIAGIMTCLPVIGVQTWKSGSKKIDWDIIILFGAGFAMAQTIVNNKTADWIALKIVSLFPALNPFYTAVLILAIVIITRLGFANMLAITAVFLPITFSLSDLWGINPVWLAQIVIIGCGFAHFLPIQSPSNLITFSYGFYNEKDLLISGSIITVILFMLVIASSLFYWPLLGLLP